MKKISIKPHKFSPKIILKAKEILKEGGLVAFPTETVYGLASRADNKKAVEKIFLIKGRDFNKPLTLFISSLKDLNLLVKKVPPWAEKIIEHFWPGPLTLVFEKSEEVPSFVTRGKKTVGIRYPDHPFCFALTSYCPFFLAVTSANISSRKSPFSAQGVEKEIGNKIDLLIDGGKTSLKVESTVLDLTQYPPLVLREGALSVEEIERVTPLQEL